MSNKIPMKCEDGQLMPFAPGDTINCSMLDDCGGGGGGGGGALPTGGIQGQSLRKVSAVDGDAAWDSLWRVNPITKALESGVLPQSGVGVLQRTLFVQGLNSDNQASVVYSDTDGNFAASSDSTQTNTNALGNAQFGSFNTQAGSGTLLVFGSNLQGGEENTQQGSQNFQTGYLNTQHGQFNAQTGAENTQDCMQCTQSGNLNAQLGNLNLQYGQGNTQTITSTQSFQHGEGNTQSGNRGFQLGTALNDGGFDNTHMFGASKTANAPNRAYFALDEAVWLKPLAAAPVTGVEPGVLYYDSTLGKLRIRTAAGWETITSV